MRVRSAFVALLMSATLLSGLASQANAETTGCASEVAMFFTPSSLNVSALTCLAANLSGQSVEIFVAPAGSVSVSARKVNAPEGNLGWSINGLGATGGGNVDSAATELGTRVADTPEVTMDPTAVSGQVTGRFSQGAGAWSVTYKTIEQL